MSRERPVESRIVHEGKLLTVRVETVELPNGARFGREIVAHPGAVVMVPVDDAGNIVLVRQYRRAADREILELPAGTLESGEDPRDAVARELAEEIGRAAGRIERLGSFYAAPGYSDELLHCFLCRDLREAAGEPEADEAIEVVPTPIEEVERLIAAGAFEDAKTLAGLALAWPKLGREIAGR